MKDEHDVVADLKVIEEAGWDANTAMLARCAIVCLTFFRELSEEIGKPIGDLTSSDILAAIKQGRERGLAHIGPGMLLTKESDCPDRKSGGQDNRSPAESKETRLFFPPPLVLGSRVWTWGEKDHGPMEGPKIDIAPNMGGTIVDLSPAYLSMDNPLYTVKWDNGQTSKHYATELCCIGHFQNWEDFDIAVKAMKIHEPVELTVGPMGGFRHAKLTITFDGKTGEVSIVDRDVWTGTLEPLVVQQNVRVTTVRLERQKPVSRRDEWRPSGRHRKAD